MQIVISKQVTCLRSPTRRKFKCWAQGKADTRDDQVPYLCKDWASDLGKVLLPTASDQVIICQHSRTEGRARTQYRVVLLNQFHQLGHDDHVGTSVDDPRF